MSGWTDCIVSMTVVEKEKEKFKTLKHVLFKKLKNICKRWIKTWSGICVQLIKHFWQRCWLSNVQLVNLLDVVTGNIIFISFNVVFSEIVAPFQYFLVQVYCFQSYKPTRGRLPDSTVSIGRLPTCHGGGTWTSQVFRRLHVCHAADTVTDRGQEFHGSWPASMEQPADRDWTEKHYLRTL